MISAARRSFSFDPRSAAFRSQRLLRGHEARSAAAHDLAQQLGGTVLPKPDELAQRGIETIEPLLSTAQIREVRAHLADFPLKDPYRRNGTFKATTIPRETHIAQYRTDHVLACPHLLKAATAPEVLSTVEGYLGAKPTLESLRLWWSTPSNGAEHVELFHRDVDDLRFVKLFIYLTDVDGTSGPHVYVPGSHRDERLTEIRRYSEAEVCKIGQATPILGPAGTSFLADTYGIHRGLPPTGRARLAFQALYTLRPSIYGPPQPLRNWKAGDGDPYVTRLFLRHASSAVRR